MFQDTSFQDASFQDASFQDASYKQAAYQAGYFHGFNTREPCPEKFPGQEEEYRRGHRKGWLEGYMNQPRAF